ncbi:LysR family transcriptional regulator [Aquabacterium sp.]|uniref:LysR family transcriptional regulator n=1 Tax=Aquabacterium sp. TaxID=1872578 RepID=UPI0037843D48
MKQLNLDYLRSFVTVAERGSFSAAAERLGLTQPAVSLQIRALERHLGTTLVERVGRVARPSAAGAELLAHAAQIEAAVAAASAAVGRRALGGAGRVRIGTGATACIFLLPPLLKKLRQAFPQLEITVTTGNTADIVKAIDENRLDVGLVTLPVAGRSFEITPVMDDEFLLIAPQGMKLPGRITAASLVGKPLLLFEPGGNTRRIADAWFARSRVQVEPIMSLGSVEAIKELVSVGLGCAILPGMAVRHLRAGSGLTVHPLVPRLHRQLATVIRRDKRLEPGLAHILNAFKGLKQPQPAARSTR